MSVLRGIALAAMLLVAACVGPGGPPRVANDAGWRDVATSADRARLRRWRDAWVAALAQASGAGHASDIVAGGVLFDPDAALDGAMPPPGEYRCRVIKLGTAADEMLAYVAYPFFGCRIGEDGGFAKLTGSQRPVGRLYPDTMARAVFLGTLVLGDEARPIEYGRDTDRNMAGFVERIGEDRWRLVLPYPTFESTLDVIELLPAA